MEVFKLWGITLLNVFQRAREIIRITESQIIESLLRISKYGERLGKHM